MCNQAPGLLLSHGHCCDWTFCRTLSKVPLLVLQLLVVVCVCKTLLCLVVDPKSKHA